MAWYDGLSKEVLQIARTPRSPLRVMAGPGTGKTRALMQRITWLLTESKVNPQRILLATFTRVAARDLQRELERVKAPSVALRHAGTLHAFCLRALMRAHVPRLTDRNPRLLLDFEERFLLEDLKSPELGDIHSRRRQLRAFEAAWAREQDQQPAWPEKSEDRVFQQLLRDWLDFHQAMLVEELIPTTLRYLRGNPACPELSMFDHVLVDEYQDLNPAEQSVIDLLSQDAKLTVAGDEDQSVYESFRYAHPQAIAQFHQTHPGTYDVPLRVCRRCPTRVVRMANSLIGNNRRRMERTLAQNPAAPRGEVHIVQWVDMQAEARGLSDFIQRRRDSHTLDLGTTLVLCPRRQFGYAIRDALQDRGVDARTFFHQEELEGNPKRLDDSKAQQAFALLTLLVAPADRVAVRSWLGFGSDDLGRLAYASVRERCINAGSTLSDVLRALAEGDVRLPGGKVVAERYDMLKRELGRLRDKRGAELCDLLFPADQQWAEPFQSVARELSDGATAKAIRRALVRSIVQPELPTHVDYVRVMSLHKSKGLSADTVIVTGCIQGLVPHLDRRLSLHERDVRLEEQRRLFYVALTRTRKTLVLSSVLYLQLALAHSIGAKVIACSRDLGRTMTSVFIDELGPSCPDPVPGRTWRSQTRL